MKRIRILYIMFFVFVFIFALTTARRELYLLIFILVLIPLISLAIGINTIFSMNTKLVFSNRTVIKGQRTYLEVEIANTTAFPFSNTKVFLAMPYPDSDMVLSITLLPKTKSIFRLPVDCIYRGNYSAKISAIVINDFFGLLSVPVPKSRLSYLKPAKLTVWPKISEINGIVPKVLSFDYKEDPTNIISNSGDSYSDLRSYVIGDSPKRIHWPSFARQHELYVRMYDAPIENSIMIFIDNSYHLSKTETDRLYYADLATQCAATIASSAANSGYAVSLDSASKPSFSVPAETENLIPLRKHLAALEFHENTYSLNNFLNAQNSKTNLFAIYLITENPSFVLYKNIKSNISVNVEFKYIYISPKDDNPTLSSKRGIDFLEITGEQDIIAKLGGDNK